METRRIEKRGDDFCLILEDKESRYKTEKLYNKGEMKDNLELVKHQMKLLMEQKGKLERELNKIDVEDSAELRELLEKLQKVNALQQKVKIEQQLKMIFEDISKNVAQEKEIKDVLPELFRGK